MKIWQLGSDSAFYEALFRFGDPDGTKSEFLQISREGGSTVCWLDSAAKHEPSVTERPRARCRGRTGVKRLYSPHQMKGEMTNDSRSGE